MNHRSKPMHRTYTSPEVKNRWNAEHYDRIVISVPKGARAEIQSAAAARGQSVAAYIRALILRDCAENGANTPLLGGGGVAERWEALMQQRTSKPELCYDLDAEPGQITLDGRVNALLDLHKLLDPEGNTPGRV